MSPIRCRLLAASVFMLRLISSPALDALHASFMRRELPGRAAGVALARLPAVGTSQASRFTLFASSSTSPALSPEKPERRSAAVSGFAFMFPWEIKQRELELELMKLDMERMRNNDTKDTERMRIEANERVAKESDRLKMEIERRKIAAFVFIGVLACCSVNFASIVVGRSFSVGITSYLVDFKALVGSISRLSDLITGGKLAGALKAGGAIGGGSAVALGLALAFGLFKK
jgi:hypothetical protein